MPILPIVVRWPSKFVRHDFLTDGARLFVAVAVLFTSGSSFADDARPVVDAAGITNTAVANTNLPTLFNVGESIVAVPEARPLPPAPPVVQNIALTASPRTVADFDQHWLFNKGEVADGAKSAFDDANWRRLDLPHDWSIEGPFGADYASGTGFAPGGIGWYRKHFRVDAAVTNKLACVEFDGIYNHSQVWLNGQLIGGQPYGYSSFECDLTPYLKFGSEENILAVRVDHSQYADSRWYTGSGIYRHVRLRLTDKLRVPQWGVFVTTPKIEKKSATVQIETAVQNSADVPVKFSLESEIVSPDGQSVGKTHTNTRLAKGANKLITQKITLAAPQLWSPETPVVYSLRSRVINRKSASGKKQSSADVLDSVETPFGIRTLRFDASQGFFLNGVSMKLKGVCLHHDAGSLGAAVPAEVWERRLRTLKEIGVNAIRTSHNPPAPEFLDLCDRLGFLVKDEAFDEFTPSKRKWVAGWNSSEPSRAGYADEFLEWSQRDIQDMVRRDRNHPSIILWSIGNEIDYANDPFSHPILGKDYHPENPPAENLVKLGRPLVAALKELDRTRPVTAAMANVPMSDAVGFGEMLDVAGYNYQEARYAEDHLKYPKRILYGSETSHQYTNWIVVRDLAYVFGQFLWTGIDYLGEAGRWPNRANGAGLLDLCGFKKPLAWYRQSLWSDRPMVYLCVGRGGYGRRGRSRGEESWNWPPDSTVTVRCFSTCPEVELRLNGRAIGTQAITEASDCVLTWEMPFEAGVLTAIGHDQGKSLCEFSLKTAGPASRIELIPDATTLNSDSGGVAQIEFRIVDANGVRVPDASSEVTFSLGGPARFLGIGNGDLNNSEDCRGKTHQAFQGHGLAILQATSAQGQISLNATAPGLEPASLTLQCH